MVVEKWSFYKGGVIVIKSDLSSSSSSGSNFIKNIIDDDLKQGKNGGLVVTRFPPEPNGYLHIGHAKSICLNFGIAQSYQTKCHLRFDDTNPAKEETEYIKSIQDDISWLGFNWGENLFYASDYFEKLFVYAKELIKSGKAYVCDLSTDAIRKERGTLTDPGVNSPHRDRTVNENLELFQKMYEGIFEDGTHVLRAKIDMNAPNLNMRDPVIYRIKKDFHPKTFDKWCIYPMYDFTHCLSDSIEGITHSLCTLEFEDHRPLYDWFLDELKVSCHPKQIEFARLNLTYTVLSKRVLRELVEGSYVSGWDDPRMPTISGMRRRGVPPAAIRKFCEQIGVTKKDSCIDVAAFESVIRTELDSTTKRLMAVIDPLQVIITNYPEDKNETISAPYNSKNPDAGRRDVPFSKEIYIDRDDFLEEPPKKFFRLTLGKEVRLRYGYVIKCDEVIKDEQGKITTLYCSYDSESLGGKTSDGRKVKGIIHWVSAKEAIPCEVRLYDRLFNVENPMKNREKRFTDFLNPDSLKIQSSFVEPAILDFKKALAFQFERVGFFCFSPDSNLSGTNSLKLIFNRIITLRDGWSKISKK